MSQQVHNTVFISYRRSTSSYLARAIYMDFKQHGYDVFMDVQSIDSGQFDQVILRQIEARAHFLLLCTPGTFDRINDPGDWLRREIEHAMLHQRNIVPIMASDFKFDATTTQHFTGKLAELSHYNALNAPHDYFEEALERLRTRFLKLPIGVKIASTPTADVKIIAEKKAELENQSPPTTNELSMEHYNRGVARNKLDYDGKVSDYSEAIRLNPQFASAYSNRGEVFRLKKNLELAIADYNEAIRINPHFAAAFYGRGLVRKELGKGEVELHRAIEDFQQFIEITSVNPSSYWMPKAQEHIRELKQKLGIK